MWYRTLFIISAPRIAMESRVLAFSRFFRYKQSFVGEGVIGFVSQVRNNLVNQLHV